MRVRVRVSMRACESRVVEHTQKTKTHLYYNEIPFSPIKYEFILLINFLIANDYLLIKLLKNLSNGSPLNIFTVCLSLLKR